MDDRLAVPTPFESTALRGDRATAGPRIEGSALATRDRRAGTVAKGARTGATSLLSAVSAAVIVAACGSSDDDGPAVAPSVPAGGDEVVTPGNGGEGTVPPDGDGGAAAVTDPAPEFEVPGEYGCDGCPDTPTETFTRSTPESSLTFTDLITGALGDGEFYVVADDGAAVGGTIPTDANGAFSFTAPLFCGVQIVKCVWSNETGRYVLITEVTREDCTDADIQLTLNWDDIGSDYELHLIKPGGSLNDDATDCTWTSCVGRSPDWGVAGDPSDDPVKDVDDTGQFGPENIFLAKPETGTYTVMVEHWGGGGPESDGEVIFNVAGRTTRASVTDFPSRHVWTVGTIDWPSGEVSLDGEIVDCGADWQSGCRLALPRAGD